MILLLVQLYTLVNCRGIKNDAREGFKIFNSHSSICFWLISVICLSLWVYLVEPFPDRDSVHQLLFPYLNSLSLSGWISSDPLFLKSAFLDTYPWGLSLISSLLGFTGLWEKAFQYPWHLPALSLIPIGIVVSIQKFKLSEKVLFCYLIFLPICPNRTQVILLPRTYYIIGITWRIDSASRNSYEK